MEREPKMVVRTTQAEKKTANGERLVDVFDISSLNRRGDYTRVAYAVPEAVAKLEWSEYIKRIRN